MSWQPGQVDKTVIDCSSNLTVQTEEITIAFTQYTQAYRNERHQPNWYFRSGSEPNVPNLI